MKEYEPEKKTAEQEDSARDLIKELGLLSTGTDFESDIQYINIIGSIEGHNRQNPHPSEIQTESPDAESEAHAECFRFVLRV